MHRSYENQGRYPHNWDPNPPTSVYTEHTTDWPRSPAVVMEVPPSTRAHNYYDDKLVYADKHDWDRRHRTSPVVNHQEHHAPEGHKKVHIVEHKKITEIDGEGKHKVREETTIDMEADGYIQQKHKNFDTCNRANTFKVIY